MDSDDDDEEEDSGKVSKEFIISLMKNTSSRNE